MIIAGKKNGSEKKYLIQGMHYPNSVRIFVGT